MEPTPLSLMEFPLCWFLFPNSVPCLLLVLPSMARIFATGRPSLAHLAPSVQKGPPAPPSFTVLTNRMKSYLAQEIPSQPTSQHLANKRCLIKVKIISLYTLTFNYFKVFSGSRNDADQRQHSCFILFERQKENLLFVSSFPRYLHWPTCCWAKVRSWELNQPKSSVRQQQDSNYLRHHCCLPESTLQGSWSQELSMDPTHSVQEWGHLNSRTNTCPSPSPLTLLQHLRLYWEMNFYA